MFLLKSTNAKYSVIPPNGHSTATLTLFIQALKSFCALLRCAPLRTVPTIVIAHTFCASPDTRISYRQCLLIQGSFCAV